MDNTAKNYNPNANVNENCVYEEKEIDIEEDKESNGLVATLLTLGTVGTSVVLIKKRHEKKTKRKKQVYKRIKMMIVIIIEKTLFFICNFSNIKSIKGFNKIADK